LRVLRSTEDGLPLIGFEPTPRSSGQRGTEARATTGDDYPPLDHAAVRWVVVALMIFWASAGFAIRSCAG